MADEKKGLIEALAEYDQIVTQLTKELLPEEGGATLRSSMLLEQDKRCGKLVGKLSSVDAKLQKCFDKAVPKCRVNSQGAASAGGFSVSEEVRSVQKDLLEAQQCLEQALFQAKKQLDAVQQSERGSIKADSLVKFAHRISQANAVASPAGWLPGDPRRPYPSDFEMRIGCLGSLGAPASAASSSAASSTCEPMPMDTSASAVAAEAAKVPAASSAESRSASNGVAASAGTSDAASSALTTGVVAPGAPQITWQPTLSFDEGDVSSDSSSSSSPPRSHGPSSYQALGQPTAQCNGDEASNAPSSSSSSQGAGRGADAGNLSADSSSSSSSSDDND